MCSCCGVTHTLHFTVKYVTFKCCVLWRVHRSEQTPFKRVLHATYYFKCCLLWRAHRSEQAPFTGVLHATYYSAEFAEAMLMGCFAQGHNKLTPLRIEPEPPYHPKYDALPS